MKSLKATREQIKRHNRQLLLRAIYSGLADNRAALALETSLAKPTVSDLVGEMIAEGFLVESGRGKSTDSGGKRPTLLRFVPDARQVIGIALDSHRIFGVLANLAGQITAEHNAERSDENVLLLIEGVINGLIAQLDAPLLCIGIGVPGVVDVDRGVVHYMSAFGTAAFPMIDTLRQSYAVPIYLGNSAELTALAEFAFGLPDGEQRQSLVTVQVDDSVTVGVTLERVAYHHGTDMSGLRVLSADGGNRRIDSVLGWAAIERRISDLTRLYPHTTLPPHDLTYMHLRFGAATGDPIVLRMYEELSTALAQIFAWVITILRPEHVALTGPIAVLGERFLNSVVQKSALLLSSEDTQPVTYSLAYTENLSAIGAAALALQQELGTL